VEFNQQIYRAPSIPKLGRRNVSSSVLRSASKISAASPTPKLRVSRAKFTGRQEPIAEAVVSNAQALAETNLILVEIQKQLSLDFAMRIAEERETIKRMKAAESRRRFGAEEKAVEGVKKVGKGILGTFNKIVSPVKSIFGKIMEFFQIILAGIAFNNIFKWLQDENNRRKVLDVINWTAKHWKELLTVFIGVKVFGFLYKLIRLGRWIGKWFGKGGPGSPKTPKTPNPIDGCGSKILDCVKGGGAKVINGLANLLATAPIFAPLFRVAGIKQPKPVQQYLPVGVEFDPARPNLKPNPRTTNTIDNFGDALIMLVGGLIGAGGYYAASGSGLGLLSKGRNLFGRAAGFAPKSLEIQRLNQLGFRSYKDLHSALRSRNIRISQSQLKKWMKNDEYVEVIRDYLRMKPGKMGKEYEDLFKRTRELDMGRKEFMSTRSQGGTIRASMGMTVPGKGSGVVDSVRAFLAPGEEVIRTAAARLFRPLLKDINNNAGRMWMAFTQGVMKLPGVILEIEENQLAMSKSLKSIEKNLKQKELKEMIGGRYKSTNFSVKSKTSSPTSSYYNMGRSAGGMTFLPMVLPTKQSPPPTIPTPQASATDVPFISPMNVADPYRQLTPEIYGIFV
jgi:hypothetical protein